MSRPGLALLSASLLFACARTEPVASHTAESAPASVIELGRAHDNTGARQPTFGPPARTKRPPRAPREPASSTHATTPRVPPEAEAWVRAHNLHRARVSPAASPALLPVAWSSELAAQAERWASRCEFDHSSGDFGENLGARTHATAPEDIVASWAGEAEHFDYRRNRCAAGQVCGHYTQVVWRDSTQIGCATVRCGGNGPFGGGQWFLSVCNYSPSGNWVGQRPY